jgi:hypothetical protein
MIKKQHNGDSSFQKQSCFFYSENLNLDNPLRVKWSTHERSLYSNMFLEDISNNMFPYSQKLNIAIIGENYDERLISSGISPDRYNNTITDAIKKFIKKYCHPLTIHQAVYFEVVYHYNPEISEPKKFSIDFIPSLTVVHQLGKFYQKIPSEIASKLNLPRSIQLDPQNIIEIKLPKKCKTKLKNALYCLDQAGNNNDFLGAITTKIANNGVMPNLQNFSAVRVAQELAIADATKEVGWNARYLLSEKITNFYYCVRYLKFMRLVTEMRNSMMEQLNQAFLIIGPKLNFSAQFQIQNVITLQDISDVEKKLFDGSISFKDVLNMWR